jgi:hypothetical protein
LTSALIGDEWSGSCPGRITPGERSPGTHWIGGWVGPSTGLDDVGRRKILPLPELKLQPLCRPARSQSLHPLRFKINFNITLLSTPRSPSGVFRSGSLIRILYAFLTNHMRATCSPIRAYLFDYLSSRPYMMKGTYCEHPPYAVFSSLLLLPLSQFQIHASLDTLFLNTLVS